MLAMEGEFLNALVRVGGVGTDSLISRPKY